MRKRWFSVLTAIVITALGLWLCHLWSPDGGLSYTVDAAPMDPLARADAPPFAPGAITAGQWVTECADCPPNIGIVSLQGQFKSLSLAVDSQDYVHIAYYQGDLQRGYLGYLYQDEAGWHPEIIDATMAGYPEPGISLALDAQDTPHISYYAYDSDVSEGELRYAYRHDAGWQIEAVGDEGTYTSLVLDDSGTPHISYQAYDFQGMVSRLMYAYRDASDWHTQTIHLVQGTSGAPNYTVLALDGEGDPHIGYLWGHNSALRYAYHDGSDWYSQTLDTLGHGSEGLSLALDDEDYAHLGYDHEDEAELIYTYQDATGWHTTTLDRKAFDGFAFAYPSMALDDTGDAHISYHDAHIGAFALEYAYQDASGWHTQTLDSEGEVGNYTSLGLDSHNYAHIAYYDDSNQRLKYAYQDTSGWHTQTVKPLSSGYVGLYTSLALDKDGYPHISYYDWSEEDLRYAYRDAWGWHRQAIDSQGDVGRYTSLALDGDGYAHISYYDATHKDLKYAYQDASGWYSQSVDSEGDVGLYTSLALEATGPYTPHISYYDATHKRPQYAYQHATGWHSQTMGRDYPGGQYTSLALDKEGRPHISYYESYYGRLIYLEQTGPTTWLSATVDYYGPSGEVGLFNALALDHNGQAHISYYHGNDDQLKYAHGRVDFVKEMVDSGKVGHYTSIALDNESYPHISYYDWFNGNLKYVHQHASGWSSQTVDQAGHVGLYTSLALDEYSHAHISYYDAQRADLKYAYYTTRTLPSVPILSQPPNGTVTTNHAITLTWQAGDGLPPEGYNVRLDGDIITTTDTMSPTVLALGVHTWTVRAYAEGYSDWASPWKVTVTENIHAIHLPLVLRNHR